MLFFGEGIGLIDGYKLQFYSADKGEPPHIHIVRAEKRAKIWLVDLSLAWSRNFNRKELNTLLTTRLYPNQVV
jgi:hypothetical protein